MTAIEKKLASILPELRYEVIIFNHPTAALQIQPHAGKEIYRVKDPRLEPQPGLKGEGSPLDSAAERESPETFFSIYLENIQKSIKAKKSVLLMNYNPAVARCTGELYKLTNAEENGALTCLAFFHTDEELSSLHPDCIDAIIDQKEETILSMNNFPFIKKYEIPVDFIINTPFIAAASLAAHGQI